MGFQRKHRAEKWAPVFRNNDATTKIQAGGSAAHRRGV
jgi:hypothetical protein